MVDAVDAARRQLKVWRRLEVGPCLVERQRVRAPYTITTDAGTATQVLTFRYAEDVFDPASTADQQLAALVAAQVALNYGLFCDELVVHGPLDDVDRDLLTDMLRNTAREIWVNKLRSPNPFLVPGALDLPHLAEPEVLCATLRLPDALPTPLVGRRFGDGVAVLASGGKDSLLTQGVCEELGLSPHALFANESGRHWYTALNAWRHLSRTRPQRTARVWTDCDRLYTFALRHLPFIRPDFDRVRADDYPIRLWTVAVFLLGVVPLMRARGLGRLLVGDEWDATQPTETDGVAHFAGYFDQSRFFDEALTFWFHRKGWAVTTASLLRPLSELLIEDTLAARYPELLALQVSCHAAHLQGERVLPCGRCEKCRRIVGMLTALGHDPAHLGYDAEAVARCLTALGARGVKQDEDGRHLAALLVDAGHLQADTPFGATALRHPVTQCLRFDPVRSPPTVLPLDLRLPSWRIFLEHARGAVQQRGEAWVSVDPLAADWARHPHAHEVAGAQSPEEDWPDGHPTHLWGNLTWPQARRRLREVDVALLPVGAVEQHGPHLPLDLDAWDAAWQCEQVALRCTEPRPLVLPLVPYGVSYHHDDFPGTLTVGPEALARLIHEIGMSAARNGIRKLVIVNGHGGNVPALDLAAQLINRDARIFTMVDTGETADAEISRLVSTPGDAHAGEVETSTCLATRPHLVFAQHARRDMPRFDSRYLDFDSDVAVAWHVRTARISSSGVLGDPTLASAEKGHAIWEITLRNMVELIEFLKRTSLDELHRGVGRDV